jgi:hypothetical protein
VAQVEKHLLSNCKALNLKYEYRHKKRKKKEKKFQIVWWYSALGRLKKEE